MCSMVFQLWKAEVHSGCGPQRHPSPGSSDAQLKSRLKSNTNWNEGYPGGDLQVNQERRQLQCWGDEEGCGQAVPRPVPPKGDHVCDDSCGIQYHWQLKCRCESPAQSWIVDISPILSIVLQPEVKEWLIEIFSPGCRQWPVFPSWLPHLSV